MEGYFRWQFGTGPVWLATLAWNMQHVLVRFFSVPTMAHTLFAHWHKDVAQYKGGTISSYAIVFAWNGISRAIGFLVRATMLVCWAVVATLTGIVSGIALVFFIAWPAAAIMGIGAGILLLMM